MREVEARLADEPERLELLLEHAQLLDELNLREQALSAYAHVLRRDPSHYAAMMRFGALLSASGNTAAARTVFAEAAQRHPGFGAPHVCLGSILLDAGDHAAALAAYERATARDPENREAHRGVAVILEREGRPDEARRRWRSAFPNGSLEISPYRGAGIAYRVLFVTSALGGNVPLQHVIDERLFEAVTLIAESAPPEIDLPPHDVLVNAVGDADRCARALAFVDAIARRSPARILNAPARVASTTREANARRFAVLPDVVSPAVVRFTREELAGADGAERLARAGFGWPVLLRSPGYHTGQHFVRVDDRDALPAAAVTLPGETLLAIAYAQTRGADGTFRKYRAMTIGGRLYPLHLAIAPEWKVHYYTAPMGDHAAHREEEAAFLADMPRTLGPRAFAALRRVAEALGLDYGGIDFTVAPDGRLVVFEANATMVILPPPADPRWDYRRAAIGTAIEAARALLLGRPCDASG